MKYSELVNSVAVIDQLETLYCENPSELVYFMTLYTRDHADRNPLSKRLCRRCRHNLVACSLGSNTRSLCGWMTTQRAHETLEEIRKLCTTGDDESEGSR